MTPTFLATPVHYTIAEFRDYLGGLAFESWLPRFPTLHNTGVPSLKQWLALARTPQERWGASLNRYYENMGWHAGPHLVVCPDYVWVLCDLTKPGVSVSCWNAETFGIEMVGNYETAGDEFASGEGAKVRDNAAMVLASLAEIFGWGDLSEIEIGARGLHFHHDCERDHHSCPGSRVTKSDILMRVAEVRDQLSNAPGRRPKAPTAVQPGHAVTAGGTAPGLVSLKEIQIGLNQLGAVPPLCVDGDFGPVTMMAVRTFQRLHGLTADGWPGAHTCAALRSAIAPKCADAS